MQNAKIGKLQANLLIFGVFLCMELGLMVGGEINVALPRIVAAIGGADLYALIFTVNIATGAIFSPIAGKMSDILGRRATFLGFVWLLFVADLLAGFSQNIYHIIILRAIQGIGGASVVVIGLIIISDVFEAETRAKYIGFYGSLNALTAIVAPIVGGLIVQNISWRWVFFSILPVGLLGIALVMANLPKIPRSQETKIDYPGVTLIAILVSVFVLITSWGGKTYAWGSPTMLILYAVMVVGGVLFYLAEKRSQNPMLPLSLFSHRIFTVCLISLFLSTAAVMSLMFYLPLFAQKVMGLTPTQSGMFITERGLLSLIVSSASGFIVARLKFFKWNAVVATIMLAVALLFFSKLTGQSQISLVIVLAALWGIANGVLTGIFQTGVQMSLPNSQMAVAMGAMQLAVTLGGTAAAAVFGMFLKTPILANGIQNIFLAAGACIFVAFLLLVLLVHKPSSETSEVAKHSIVA